MKPTRKKRPIADYVKLREEIAEFLPISGLKIAKSPEVVAMRWRPKGDVEKERYIEIRIPIEIE